MLSYFVLKDCYACLHSLRSLVLACRINEYFNTITTMTRAAT